jgi:hypothetical protein
MKITILATIISMWTITLSAQVESSVEVETTRKLTKEQKREQQRLRNEETAKLVNWMVESRQFVLEANYLSNQNGNRVIVSPLINFIAVDSARLTIQLASTTGSGGANGLGGVTTDGQISKFDVKKTGKYKDIYSIRILTMTSIGSFDIFLTVYPSGNADASISGNWGGKLNYYGILVPLKQSKVYKGMAI